MVGSRIRPGLAVGLGAAVVGIGLAAALVAGRVGERVLEQAASESLRAAAGMFATLQRSEVDKLAAALDVLRSRQDLREAFLARDRARLAAIAGPVFDELRARDGLTHWYFIEPNRTCFLRVHRRELFGDRIERVTLARAAETGNTASGMELGQTAYALRVVRPWFADGRLIGFLELSEEIGHFLVRMKQETGNDFGLLARKKFLDEKAWYRVSGTGRDTWNARPDVVVVDTTSFGQGLIDFPGDVGDLPDDGLLLDEEERGGKAWIRGIFPVRDAADRRVGAMVVLHDFTATHMSLERGRSRIAAVVVLFSVLAFLASWLALERLLLRRLERAVAALEAGGRGDDTGDEMQRLERLAAMRQPDARQSDAPAPR